MWIFLLEALPFLLYVLCFLLIGGKLLLDFLRGLYEARQKRLIAELQARVRLEELALERERERNRPKSDYPANDLVKDQPYQPYREGLQELPPQY